MAQDEQQHGAAAGHHQACDHHHGHDRAGHSHAKPAAGSCCGAKPESGDQEVAVAIDPVCGMRVDIATAKHRFEYGAREYLFCSGRCRERFAADPEKFLTSKASEQKQAEPAPPAGIIYTCPMDPEVRQVGPGTCPICGMADRKSVV